MLALRVCAFLATAVTLGQTAMEGFIVGGAFTSINRYPHSAFLTVNCLTSQGKRLHWICGSSILNQNILLTAAHCLYTCVPASRISANMGSEHRENGILRIVNGFIIHDKYFHERSLYDIGMVRLDRPVKFSSTISRVAIMKKPPYHEQANLAGWGQTNEKTKAQGIILKEVEQTIWNHEQCERLFGKLPIGTICASSKNRDGFAAAGDSGSGLVVRGYIQVGLVSFKKPLTSANIIVYTDVGYFYDWISYNAHRLYCFTNLV